MKFIRLEYIVVLGTKIMTIVMVRQTLDVNYCLGVLNEGLGSC